MSYPRFQRSRDFKFTTRATTNISLPASLTYVNVDTALDITLPAETGDVLEVVLSALSITAAGSGLGYNVCSVVSGSAVNNYASGSIGHSAWWCPANSTNGSKSGGSLFYTLVAGDLSAGTVTTRLRYIDDVASGTHSVFASSTLALMLGVKNLGPKDPN